jgi:hypothetical protein
MDSKNHDKDWYIGAPTTVTLINKRLKSFQVPHSFREPKLIDKKVSWKGFEVILLMLKIFSYRL